MRKRTNTRSLKEQKELEEIYRSKFKSPVWTYFKDVKRITRPYVTSDFNRGYFIPDL